MRRAIYALPVLSLLAFAPACDSEQDDMGDAFRNATLDVNISLSQADGGDNDGTILWELLEGQIYEGAAADGNLKLFIQNNTIYDVSGQATCTVNSPFLYSSVREVRSTSGSDVLFTVWNQYVFDGQVDVKHENFGQMKKLFGSQLLFQFEDDDVFLGEAYENFRLINASADIEDSSDGRKLLIAALITGECGSSGMPGYTF